MVLAFGEVGYSAYLAHRGARDAGLFDAVGTEANLRASRGGAGPRWSSSSRQSRPRGGRADVRRDVADHLRAGHALRTL
jgi:hypothetical protein